MKWADLAVRQQIMSAWGRWEQVSHPQSHSLIASSSRGLRFFLSLEHKELAAPGKPGPPLPGSACRPFTPSPTQRPLNERPLSAWEGMQDKGKSNLPDDWEEANICSFNLRAIRQRKGG